MNNFEQTEFLKCADPMTGPEYFLKNYFYIQHPIKGSVLLDLYDYQVKLINSYIDNRFSINLIARQLGKTAVTAGYLLWYALFKNDQTIVIGANKHAAANEILARILYGYDYCPDFLKASLTTRNKMSLQFDNGSRIVTQAVTPHLCRGMAISLLYLDEYAYVRKDVAREAWSTLWPTLTTGGSAIINSTANYETDHFATMWKDACHLRSPFIPYSVDWSEHPDRDLAWANDTARMIGRNRFAVEHENRFIENV